MTASDNTAVVQALVDARNADPFAFLGPHEVGPGQWEVRAILPHANRAFLVQGETTIEMRRRHDAGVFAGDIKSTVRPRYRLKVETNYGTEIREDPYAFDTAITDADLPRISVVGDDMVYNVLGAQRRSYRDVAGFSFAVWAPNARRVSIIGDFNDWDGRRNPMRLRHEAGVWELFLPEVQEGAHYKFEIVGPNGVLLPLKADPVAFSAEKRPSTASIVAGLPGHQWRDDAWMATRGSGDRRRQPISIYEVHLGSWARGDEGRYLTYAELAEKLIPYVVDMGFTHIELLPITEHPFDGSWGYQPVSLFAPTSRFGTPEDFAEFVEVAHAAGVGIILDWVPGHFPMDAHGLGQFDGTHLYEHADPRQGMHQDWGTYIYNFGRPEVASYLAANARFWLEQYHLDGLRVDAVASMLYLDYSRKPGQWVPNAYGGNENLEAIDFLRKVNESVYNASPGVMTIAEESTSWPGVSHPTYKGGLGFGFKWNMGWMHDTLQFMAQDPIHRRYNHHDMTFALHYAYSENFVLPLSHDEVVHGKRSLLGKMPGDRWQQFANLRAYFGFMWAHPGKKLLFMGCEIAQEREWNHDQSLDWHLLDDPQHAGMKRLVRDLNRLYQGTPALYELDCDPAGFTWLVSDDQNNSVYAWARHGTDADAMSVVVSNFTPVPRIGYRVGVPKPGFYTERFNSDAETYGGANVGNFGGAHTQESECHGFSYALTLTLPPLSTIILERKL